MIEKIKTAIWFLKRPSFWRQALELALRKFSKDKDSGQHRSAATDWAAEKTVSVQEALCVIGLIDKGTTIPAFPNALLEEGEQRAQGSAVSMGGPGDLNLLYGAVKASGAKKNIETGVAYGWSSLAILAGMEANDGAKLVSVDMPYPKMNNEDFVGIVVPERFRSVWKLIREPDRNGLRKAVASFGGTIDLCHYDSDKSYRGRQFAYPLLWKALRTGGVFISDDIQDNLAFKEFVEDKELPFAITSYEGKYIGVMKKP